MTEQLSFEHLRRWGFAPGSYHCFCSECGKQHTGDKRSWRCLECAEAKVIAEQQNTRPSATPGNTDPIAKDDDELRKVQGGWRKDVTTEYVYPPIPDRSRDWCAWFRWHDGDTDLRGYGKTELDAVFDLFQNALDFEDGDGSEQEAVLDAAWLGIGGSHPTEHPTEQPDVRDAAQQSNSQKRGIKMTNIHTAQKVPYSSIVGQSIMLLDEAGACVAMLAVMNSDDPQGIADQVVAAISAQASRPAPDATDSDWEEKARRDATA